MIIWKGVIKNSSQYQKADLNRNARKLNMPTSLEEIMIKAMPFLSPSICIIFVSILAKTLNAGQCVISPITFIIGFFVGFLLLLIHEFLHAVVYPKEATVYIGIIPKQFAAVALASYPLNRSRFILMSLLPYILGIIPITLFWISSAEHAYLNGFYFGVSIMGLTSPYVDLFNVFQVLKQTKKGDKLQFYQDDLYVIRGEIK